MAAPETKEWFKRGRTHQLEGRPVEAAGCFQRVVRLAPAAPEARFRLGEVMWQLGRLPDAIASWEDAVKLAPRNLVPAVALAEAHLALGDLAAAHAAGVRAAAIAPADARAGGTAALTSTMFAQDARDAAALAAEGDRLAHAVENAPSLLAIPAFGDMLARALDREGEGTLPDDVRARICRAVVGQASAGATVPGALVASACEWAVHGRADASPLFAAALGMRWMPVERDAMRRIARAAVAAGDDRAAALGEGYARLCAAELAGSPPIVWPLRTAGPRCRVVVLVAVRGIDPPALGALSDVLATDAGTVETFVALVGGAALPADWPLPEAARAVRVIPLATDPDAGDAKRIAALDADLLVDLVGLDAAVGKLLAYAPARRCVTLPVLPRRHREPLAETLPADTPIDRWLAGFAHVAGQSPASGFDVAATTALWNDAVAAHQRGDLAAAIDAYDRFLAAQPGCAPAMHLAAVARRDAGDADGAARLLAATLDVAPRYTDAVVAAARLALSRSDPDTAARVCIAGLEAGGPVVAVLRMLGLAELARRDGAAASAAFARALDLEPFDGETHYNFGVALQMQRRPAEAARAYQRAVFFRPDLTSADFNLGVLMQEQQAWEAAAAAYETVLHADPGHIGAHKNLGEVLYASGQFDRWFASFDRFEAQCPKSLPMAVQGLEVCQHRGDFARLERIIDGLRQQQYTPADETELVDSLEELLYLLLFFDLEPAAYAGFARTYDTVARKVYGEPLPRPGTRRPGRLRIGYLSADLRDHVMGKMMFSALEHSDRSRFELRFYSLSEAEDAWTARFRALGDHYDVLAGLDERAAAKRIAEDDLDVLVDLSTHTKGAKPGILALKPARVVITHVASAGAVGLSAIDFKLTDRFADLPENQEHLVERLLAMEGCVYPYRHLPPAAVPLYERRRLGIADDAFVIGAFVAVLKLSRRCLRLWREVLERVPRAVIAFSPMSEALRLPYRRVMAAAGIAPNRYVFLPQGRDEAENQARYRVVDAVLDPMPYGGVNGTLEALDMGVPVVTLCGKRHGERSTYSILANLGVTATVAHTGRDYVELAARLAEDPAFMADVRAAIARGLAQSPLTDRIGHTRALERAYEQALAFAEAEGPR